MCKYCNNKNNNTHFSCEICGIGMCDECYDNDVEHFNHANEPFELLESDKKVDLVLKACKEIEPSYLCFCCLDKALKEKM